MTQRTELQDTILTILMDGTPKDRATILAEIHEWPGMDGVNGMGLGPCLKAMVNRGWVKKKGQHSYEITDVGLRLAEDPHPMIGAGRETVSTTAVDDQTGPAVSNDEALRQAFEKQPRYQDANGDDWIDEFARTSTPEEFRGAMRFTIGKYERRLGKKDPVPMELRKMADYYLRWAEVEEARK